jgi:phosphodiesterase/alkaline phosphatase D-like protein
LNEQEVPLLLGPLVGGLTHNQAYLWGRGTGPGSLHAWIGVQPNLEDAALGGISLPLREENGFAGVAPVYDLDENRRYHYALSLDDQPPIPGKRVFPAFTTMPVPGERVSFSFAFGSCFRAKNRGGGGIFTAMDRQRQIDQLRFGLFIGDQIYADAYKFNGLGKIACSLAEYRQAYTYNWTRPALRRLMLNLPLFMTLDDHEVDDDWTWVDASRTQARIPLWDRLGRVMKRRPWEEIHLTSQRVRSALQAYWEHQGMHAPGYLDALKVDKDSRYLLDIFDLGSLAYAFTCGAAAFFVMDTRSMRVKSRHTRTMLGAGQWKILEAWLLEVKDKYPVKFIVSSCAFLYSLWVDLARDRWSGFPQERNRLLHFLAANGIQGVYFLVGDLHAAHAVKVDLYGPRERELPVYEFCSSPFEQEPNRWSRLTYSPLRAGPVRKSERFFCQAQANFGVVDVWFSEPQIPRVDFRLFNQEGVLLKQVDSTVSMH